MQYPFFPRMTDRGIRGFFFLIIGVLFIAGCNRKNDAFPQQVAVAKVDDYKITDEAFNTSYVNKLIATGSNDTKENRYKRLNELIDTVLLSDEAEERGMGADSLFISELERARKEALGGRYFETAF